MKLSKFLFAGCLAAAMSVAVSCGKSNNPVDQYVDVLDKAISTMEKVNSAEELSTAQSLISPEDAAEIVRNNADYELTEADKEKLKKAEHKLIDLSIEKTLKYNNLPEEYKEAAKAQMELLIDANDKRIDNAKTLGDLGNL
ncbi:MAG: hypothetical protein J1E78_05465 [Muribaculaceae bacterium]|nr:hypothetical protein [Muribaculaceae bacterium]